MCSKYHKQVLELRLEVGFWPQEPWLTLTLLGSPVSRHQKGTSVGTREQQWSAILVVSVWGEDRGSWAMAGQSAR